MVSLIGRAYVAFSLAATLAGLAAAWIDGDHPLRSDDPYIVGLLLGGVAAALAAVYALIQRIPSPPTPKFAPEVVYFGALLLWAIFWLLVDRQAVEGQGIGMLIAGASLATGVVSWPLSKFRIPAIAATVIGAFGGLFVALCVYNFIRVAAY